MANAHDRSRKSLRPVRWEVDEWTDTFKPRSVPKNIPVANIGDAPYACLIINEEWSRHIAGFLAALAQPDHWRGSPNEILRCIDAFEALTYQLYSPCTLGDNMPLRQNPLDPCELQQLQGGEWFTVFDYSKCKSGQDIYSYRLYLNYLATSVTDVMNQTTNNWIQNNSIINIAPEIIYTGEPENDNYRDLALCRSTHDLVEICVSLVLAQRGQESMGANIGAIILGAVATAFTLSASVASFGTATPLALAISGVLVSTYATAWTGISDVVLNNENAQRNVACCMYEHLKGLTPSRSSVETSLDSCEFEFGSVEAQLAGAIAPLLSEDSVFANWLTVWNENVLAARLGLINHCVCNTTTIFSWIVPTAGEINDYTSGNYDLSAYPDVSSFIGLPDIYQVNENLFGAGFYLGGATTKTGTASFILTLNNETTIQSLTLRLIRNRTSTTSSIVNIYYDDILIETKTLSNAEGDRNKEYNYELLGIATEIKIEYVVTQTYCTAFIQSVVVNT